jgi:hypothetical protein
MYELVCQGCFVYSDVYAVGWRGYRIDDPDDKEPPELAFYCPACATREFGTGTDPRLHEREGS